MVDQEAPSHVGVRTNEDEAKAAVAYSAVAYHRKAQPPRNEIAGPKTRRSEIILAQDECCAKNKGHTQDESWASHEVLLRSIRSRFRP